MKKTPMPLNEVVTRLQLKVVTPGEDRNIQVTGGYAGDLLSDVMGNAGKGFLWITLQEHPNIVAVAVLKQLAGIILTLGHQPENETVDKAKKEKVAIFSSDLPAFELIGRLYEMGVSGLI